MADAECAYYAQEIARQKAEEQRRIDQSIQQNCLAVAVNQMERQIVRENPDISEIVKANPELAHDSQTRRFAEFVSIATNFASMKFVDRLRNIPDLINSIKNLFIEMIKEIKDFADIARELQDLIHSFIKLVVNTKRNMELVIAPLQESINHMEIIADALSPDSNKPLETRDKEDVEIALQGMSSGIEKLLQLAKTSKQESSDLDDKIARMKGNIQVKRIIVEGRLKTAELAPWIGLGGGAIGGFLGAGAAITAESFGGAGVLVIGGVACNPFLAVIAAALMGGTLLGSIVYVVQDLWTKHNVKALNYLNQILDLLVKLSDDNLCFANYMNKAEVHASKILNETGQIQRTITTGSERYRKLNVRLCTEAIQSTKAVITCIDEIVNIDMSQWTNSSSVLNYASSPNTTSTAKAIQN